MNTEEQIPDVPAKERGIIALVRQPESWTLGTLLVGTLILPYFANIGACFYLLALVPFGLSCFANPDRSRVRDPALWWMATYTAAALALTPLTPYPLYNLYGLFTRFAFYFLVYWLVHVTFSSPWHRERMYWAIVIGGWICSWLGLWQYFGPQICQWQGHQSFYRWEVFQGALTVQLSCNQFHVQAGRLPFEQYPGMMPYFFVDLIMLPQYDGRSRSILMGPTIFGVWLVLMLPLVIQAVVAARVRWLKVLSVLNLAATVVVLLLTFTRNAWVCSVLVLGLYIILTRRWMMAAAFAGLGGASLAGMMALRPGAWHFFVERVMSIPSLTYQSNAERLLMWKSSLAQIAHHPLAGVSNYGYRLAVPELWNMGWPHAHNYWIHTALETGIPLMIFITFIMAAITVRGWKRLRELPADDRQRGWQEAAFCGVIGFFLMGIVDYTAYEPRNYHIFWLYLALL